MSGDHRFSTEQLGAFCGALFLFGLALLFQLDWIWPGIVPLIWITAAPLVMTELGWQFGLWVLTQTTIWTAGPALLFKFDRIWPGILALAGLSALLVAIAPPGQLQAQRGYGGYNIKRKRGLPLPAVEQDGPLADDMEAVEGADTEAVSSELSGNHRSVRHR